MLLALRSSSLHRPLRLQHARFLTTYPRPTANYDKVWDPTEFTLLPPLQHTKNPEGDPRDALVDEQRQLERRALRDAQTLAIDHQPQNDQQNYAVRRLNLNLKLGLKILDQGQFRSSLWDAYVRAKSCVPTLPSLMPDKAWDVLWDTQVKRSRRERDTRIQRSEQDSIHDAHVGEIHSDMGSVGKTPVGQRVAYLESLFFQGNEEQASSGWEDDHSGTETSSRHDYKPEHLELGVKLHAFAGHLDRAQRIMRHLFDLYPTWDASVMLSVLRAHTERDFPKHHDTAKTIYLGLREKLGSDMTLEDYDACFVGFLQARHLRYAKQVFRDMVKDGTLATSFSTEDVENVLTRLHMLYRLGTDIEKMTGIALQALSILPQSYHSHIFSEWMNAAVRWNAPEVAAQVLDMMFSRGYRPETAHFNYLLKALFRTKEEPRVLKAENIGWRMIEEARRTPSVKRPNFRAPQIIAQRADMITETVLDSEAARQVPKANITTFTLMMQHHGTNLQWEYVDYLMRLWRTTDIQPNAGFMNIVMDNCCRKGKYSEVWQTYEALTDVPGGRPGVFPDGSSIRCLWKTLRIALGDPASRDNPDLPTPRELLAETVLWWARCRSRSDVEQFRVGLASADHDAITSLIMHCFSYTQDFAGSLVALHVARTMSIFPTDKTAAILQSQAAWVDMNRETDSVRSQYHHNKNHKNIVDKLGRVYYILMERRLKRAGLTEASFDIMSDEELGDLGLNLLSEFVRVIMKRSYAPETVEAMITKAKEEVGVPDISTGDLDAFSVA